MEEAVPAGPPAEGHHNNTLIIGILAAVAIVVVVAVFFVFRGGVPSGQETSQPAATVEEPQTQVAEVAVLPADVPIDRDAGVITNYSAVAPDGRLQATRALRSPRSVADNFAFYKSFFAQKSSGWTILNEVDDPDRPQHKAVFARNDEGVVNVNIAEGSEPGTSIIDISFVTQGAGE